jgi:NTE family protein
MDGVAVNNLPVRAAQSLGADYVVAVDLLPLGGRMLPEPRNVIEMSIQALYTLARATQIEAKLADVIIAPDIAHVNLADLRAQSIDDLLQAGRLAAEAVLPQIRRDLGRA